MACGLYSGDAIYRVYTSIRMVGTLGIEPRTDRLKAECSTAELGALTSNPQ